MPSIIVRRDGKPTQEIILEKGFTLIGKKPEADIRIEDVEGVDERASILQVGDDFVLNELCAVEGILVNGQGVKKRILKDRDLILIGEYRMTFQDKREIDKPQGIEMEIAEMRPAVDLAPHLGKSADPFAKRPGSKSHLLIYLVIGAIILGIGFSSYQSYLDRQAADAQAALAYKAMQE